MARRWLLKVSSEAGGRDGVTTCGSDGEVPHQAEAKPSRVGNGRHRGDRGVGQSQPSDRVGDRVHRSIECAPRRTRVLGRRAGSPFWTLKTPGFHGLRRGSQPGNGEGGLVAQAARARPARVPPIRGSWTVTLRPLLLSDSGTIKCHSRRSRICYSGTLCLRVAAARLDGSSSLVIINAPCQRPARKARPQEQALPGRLGRFGRRPSASRCAVGASRTPPWQPDRFALPDPTRRRVPEEGP